MVSLSLPFPADLVDPGREDDNRYTSKAKGGGGLLTKDMLAEANSPEI